MTLFLELLPKKSTEPRRPISTQGWNCLFVISITTWPWKMIFIIWGERFFFLSLSHFHYFALILTTCHLMKCPLFVPPLLLTFLVVDGWTSASVLERAVPYCPLAWFGLFKLTWGLWQKISVCLPCNSNHILHKWFVWVVSYVQGDIHTWIVFKWWALFVLRRWSLRYIAEWVEPPNGAVVWKLLKCQMHQV